MKKYPAGNPTPSMGGEMDKNGMAKMVKIKLFISAIIKFPVYDMAVD